MSGLKTGNSKKSFMREHECRFCLYYRSCARKECIFDGTGGEVKRGDGESGGVLKRGADSADTT